MIRALFTPDIPSEARELLVEAWAPFDLRAGGEVHRKAAGELQGFIQLMGNAIDWLPLKIAATLFLSRLAQEAASDAYRHKATIAKILGDAACAPIRVAAGGLVRARLDSPGQPGVVLGLSVPDDFFGTALSLDSTSEEETAVLLARFSTSAQAIEDTMKAEVATGQRPMGRVMVTPVATGGFTLTWLDHSLKHHEKHVN